MVCGAAVGVRRAVGGYAQVSLKEDIEDLFWSWIQGVGLKAVIVPPAVCSESPTGIDGRDVSVATISQVDVSDGPSQDMYFPLA